MNSNRAVGHPTRVALVLGASGSVGNALIRELVRSGAFKPIVTFVRRSQAEHVALAGAAGIELREVVVTDMQPAALKRAVLDTIASLDDGDMVGFSVLGIGAGTAKVTIDEHRAIDVELNAAFARALRASARVEHLAFMSVVGANPKVYPGGSGAAGTGRYIRVKGEAEEAVLANGPRVVSIFRPAVILGSQHTPKALATLLPMFSFMTPARFRSISTEQIARAMIATALNTPEKSAVYHYPEMAALDKSLPGTPPSEM